MRNCAVPVRESGFALREARFFMRTCDEPRVTRAYSVGDTRRSRVCVQVHARAYRCHNFASCLCLHHTCYGEHSCSCRLCMLPASQPAGITFQWSRCFQWFLTAWARARARAHACIVGFSILCKLSRGIAKTNGPPSTRERFSKQ